MASEIESVRSELIELWGGLGRFWGIPPSTARIYAYLLSVELADGDAIATELETSRGAVSMACRELVDWGIVRQVRRAGSRRVAYVVEEDPSKVIRAIVNTRKRREWDPLLEHTRTWLERIGKDRSTEARVVRRRLEDIQGLVAQIDSMAESFLRGGVVTKIGMKALIATARRRRAR